jgi:hypothetical protein
MQKLARLATRSAAFTSALLAVGCGGTTDFFDAGIPMTDGAAGEPSSDAPSDVSIDAGATDGSFDALVVENASGDAPLVPLDVAPGDDTPSPDAEADVVDKGDGRLGDGSACPCVCTPTGCPAACVSFATDTKNCGFTGHDCQGASCSEGQCQPTTVDTGDNFRGLTVESGRVYYSSGGSMSPYGGLLNSASTNLDGQPHVGYHNWSLGADMVAVNATDIFASFNNVAGVMVKRISKSSDPPSTAWTKIIDMGGGTAGRLLLDATHVYWTVVIGGAVPLAFPNSVVRASIEPVDGGLPEVIATDQQRPWGLAVSGGHVYWTSRDGGAIRKVPVAGGTPETLAAGQGDPLDLAVFDGYVYWTDLKQDTVMRVAIDGGNAEVVARDQDGPSHIAVDASGVYWTSERGFRVMKATVVDASRRCWRRI